MLYNMYFLAHVGTVQCDGRHKEHAGIAPSSGADSEERLAQRGVIQPANIAEPHPIRLVRLLVSKLEIARAADPKQHVDVRVAQLVLLAERGDLVVLHDGQLAIWA